ncbi:NACHT domain-containing protein [Myxosarcina sp. GI1]|uniref:NACHT C-terminal helical domain 2-containing protein n=1 Tax=Myxosarcina sp. GI1 TaxID=1541065 RepID=UPI00068C1E70|nr:NACHT domain-containing protein [Myxosarcina sp. GI1]
MGIKSLKASEQGIAKAKKAMTSSKLQQKDLIARIDCSRQPVSKFFNSKPISSELFVKICDSLNLDWEEIRENEQTTQDIDTLVSEVRQKAQTDIVERCGTMRVLDMRQPIGLNDIYTDVYLLEKITGSQRLEIDQLSRDYNPDSDDFDRHWLNKREKRVSGIYIVDKSSKVVILGKPGSGKTTFLKFLCLQCISGGFQPKRLPIFISLKEFAEKKGKPDLLNFIQHKFEHFSVTKEEIMKILTYGRSLIVLDGLDEVNEEDNERVINEIANFSYTYSLASNVQKYLKEHSHKRDSIQEKIKQIKNKKEKNTRHSKLVNEHYKTLKNVLCNEEELKYNIHNLFEKIKQFEKEEIEKKEIELENIQKNLETKKKQFKKFNGQKELNSEFEDLKIKTKYLENKKKIPDKIKRILEFLENLKKEIPKACQVLEYKQDNEEINKLLKNSESPLQKWQKNPELFLKILQEEKLILKSLENFGNHLNKQIEQKEKELKENYPDLNKSQDLRQKFISKRFPDTVYETHFVITCRIASLDFNFIRFTEVELADFNDQQIQVFVHKWFAQKDPVKENNFLQQLSLNDSIKELANSPLLLILLCLVFAEVGNFPKNRSDLYNEGIKILLEKWDIERNIYRDQIYKNLTNNRKQDLLSQIAFITFDRKDYFFKQKEVEKHISTYIQNLPEAKTDPEILRLDSEVVLKSIEAQHGLLIERARGIYSFSHLTFQEYFTARKITETSNPKMLEKSLRNLASHIQEKRWREVFLLAIGLLSKADFLIQNMKEQVDLIAAQYRELQSLLEWAHQRAFYLQSSEKLSTIRIHYLTLAFQLLKITPINLPSNYLKDLINTIKVSSQAELIRQSFVLDSKLSEAYYLPRNLRYNSKFAIVIAKSNNNILKFHFDGKWLNILKKPIPNPDNNQPLFETWWKSNGKSWTQQLNFFFSQQPKTIPNFNLASGQLALLKQYYISNEFLLECMNTNCVIDRKIRQEIENSLFLPISEIDVLVG